MQKFFFLCFFILNVSCSSLFFYPDKRQYINPNLLTFKREEVFFYSNDGIKLHGWFFPSKEDKGTIIFLHGNAENIGTHINSALWFINEGYNVFVFDYRGYGKSEGRPTILGVHIDAESAIKFILSKEGISKNLIIFGQSIGGAIAITTVANSQYKETIKAMIIESAFSGYRTIAKDKISVNWFTKILGYPLLFLINDDFSPAYFVEYLSPIPVLFLHGCNDKIVPCYHTKILYEKAKEPKKILIKEKAKHINVTRYIDVQKEILKFLSNIEGLKD